MRNILVLMCLLSICVVSYSEENASPLKTDWELVIHEAAFSPRDTAEEAVFKRKLWLSNGYFHGNVLIRDLWNSVDGKTWTQVLEETPYGGYSELAVFKGKLWAVKGSVWSSEDGVIWTQVLAETPFGMRGYGEVVVHDGKLWHLGHGADVWQSEDGVTWKCVTKSALFGNRIAAAVTVYDGKLWLMGGRIDTPNRVPEKGYNTITTYNDVWTSKDGVEWERITRKAPWSPRMWFPVRSYAGRLWVLGGYDNVNGDNLGDVWYSKDGKDWQALKSETTFSRRHEPACYVYNDYLWIVAGNGWPVVNDVWRLKITNE